MSHLHIDGLSFSYAGHRVLTNISYVISQQDRVGLIGENGSGKSTLLKLIAGVLPVSEGAIALKGLTSNSSPIGLLHQEPPFSTEETVSQALEQAAEPARKAAQSVTELGNAIAQEPDNPRIGEAYAEALEDADRCGAWDIDAKISVTLHGLGLAGLERSKRTRELSGGQRARLALGWLLINKPEVLLLDEPTNHLDDQAVAYLVSVLSAWRGPVLMASHDRAFLDEAATSLIDLDPSPVPHAISHSLLQDGAGTGIGITRFTGNYTDYLRSRDDALTRWKHQYRQEQDELTRLRKAVQDQQTVGHDDWVPRSEVRMAQKFYADRNAKVVSRRVNDARNRLQLLEEQQVRKPPQELKFSGITAGSRAEVSEREGAVVVAKNLAVKKRLSQTSMTINRGEKWLITGPNGSGKSTLLHVLAGDLEPTDGHLRRSTQDRFALFTQETTLADPYERGPSRTVAQTYRDLVGEEVSEKIPLSRFGLLAPRDEVRAVNTLSVGQQRRLALAILLADPPEVLLLDEPTNHFSLGLVTALEKSLKEFAGTVVIASHDRWLRRRWNGKTLAL